MLNKAPTADNSIGAILADLADNSQALVRQQVELVKVETTEKIKEQAQQKGKAVGLLVGGGIFALLGLAFLGVMLLLGLSTWFDLAGWISALIVTLLYFAIGGLLAFLGKKALTPKETPESDPTTIATPQLPASH